MTAGPARPLWPWLLLTLLALASAAFAWRLFPASYPLLDLEVRMARGDALAAADSLAEAHALGPEDPRQVAVFRGDPEAQTFVELEGGGPEAFRALVQAGDLRAWEWQVRRFRPGSPHEVTLHFEPGGRPAGFREQLPEDAPGAALAADSARALALAAARAWGVQPGPEWVERPAGVESRPAGRRDHTFTWERRHPALGEGRFLLRLVVTGDRLSELSRTVEVPEAFNRRYREIRSANEGLALGANLAMVLLYGLGGIVAGLVALARRQRLDARRALGWAAALAAIVTASLVNYLPLSWLEYDTAVTAEMFRLQQLGLVVASLAGLSLLFGASFLGGENLARAGFGRHPYLWGVFSREAGGSSGMLRRVGLGMLLTPVFLAYMVAFGVLTRDWTGWWSPITPLIEPNLIATPLPWLEVIAAPLQAAVWEELLFRAVPFGVALLLARRFGGPRAWIAVAFVVQAVVFSAAHANYPAQPAYARLVELLLPSALFGVLFLRWGLVPAIVLHFEYDLALFALPLFTTPAGALPGSKVIVVLAGLAPLGLVLLRRLQAGAWRPLPDTSRNAAHQAPPHRPAESGVPLAASTPAGPALARPARFGLLAAVTAVGTVAWILSIRPPAATPARIEVSRDQAVASARDTLVTLGVDPATWTDHARIVAGTGDPHRYVWEVGGPSVYTALLGRYLPAPRWEVAFRRYDLDVIERAEEWLVTVAGDGRVLRVTHRLPDSRAGAALEEPDARRTADSTLLAAYGIDADSMELVAAVPTEHAARRDWTFTYAHPPDSLLGEGRLRVEVELGGDNVIRTGRSVQVPEEWQRARRAGEMPRLLPALFGAVVIGGLWLVAAVAALSHWSRGALDWRRAVAVGLAGLLCSLLTAWNSWPAAQFSFQTVEPFAFQRTVALVSAGVGALFMSGAMGLLAGLPFAGARASGAGGWLPGLSLGAATLGLRGLVTTLRQGERPPEGDAGPLDLALPFVAPAIGALLSLLIVTATFVAAAWAWQATRRGHGIRRAAGGVLLLGLALAAGGAGQSAAGVLAVAVGGGLLLTWWGLGSVLPGSRQAPAVAAMVLAAATPATHLVTDPWPGSRMAALLALAALALVTPALARLLERDTGTAPAGEAPEPVEA